MSTRLYGRDAEFVQVRDWLGRVVEGRGGVATVEGPAGIGKTRLLAEAAGLAADTGFLVVSARTDQLGGVAPMAALLDAFRDSDPPIVTSEDMAGLAALADQRCWLLDRLRSALEKRAGRGPVLVMVDDLQWADPATLWAIGALATQLTAVPVAWLLALRSAPAPEQLSALLAKLRQLEVLPVGLRPLAAGAADALAADLLGGVPGEELLDLVRRAEGNPFLVVEAVRASERAGASPLGGVGESHEGTLPVGFAVSARTRLTGLDPDSRQLVEVGAIFGRRFGVPELSTMVDQPVATLMPALRELIRAGVLQEEGDRLSFAHDLLWQAVYEDIPLAARRVLHRDAARALLATDAPPLDVANHLLAGARPGDVEAIDLLLRAAADAAPRAPDTAGDLYQRVLSLAPRPGPVYTKAVVEAVPVLVRAGRLEEMRAIAERALAAGVDPASQAAIHYNVSVGEALWGHYADALAECRVGLARRDLAEPDRARLSSVEALYLAMSGKAGAAIRTALSAVEAGERTGQVVAVTMGLSAEAIAQRLSGRFADAAGLADEASRRADAATPAARLLQPRRWYAWMLTALDRFEEAESAYLASRRDMDSYGLGVLLHVWHVHLAGLRLAAGRLDEAAAAAEAAIAVAEEVQTAALLPTALALLARIAIARGDLDQARRYLARAPSSGESVYELELDYARGLVEEAAGNPVAADEQLATVWSAFTHHFGLLALAPAAGPGLVRIALAAGDRSNAQLAADAASRLAAYNPGVATVTGGAAHAAGLLDGDADQLVAALGVYAGSPRPLPRAAALEDAGLAVGAQSGRAEAVAYLEEALGLYADADAGGDAARVRRYLRDLGVRQHRVAPAMPRHGWASLSASERRVARRVATGLTNRAVADQLYLSRHTVDSHLRHIFAKLDINTRVELTRIVVENQRDATSPPS